MCSWCARSALLCTERCQADGSSFADGLHKHLKARIVNTDSLGWVRT